MTEILKGGIVATDEDFNIQNWSTVSDSNVDPEPPVEKADEEIEENFKDG